MKTTKSDIEFLRQICGTLTGEDKRRMASIVKALTHEPTPEPVCGHMQDMVKGIKELTTKLYVSLELPVALHCHVCSRIEEADEDVTHGVRGSGSR